MRGSKHVLLWRNIAVTSLLAAHVALLGSVVSGTVTLHHVVQRTKRKATVLCQPGQATASSIV